MIQNDLLDFLTANWAELLLAIAGFWKVVINLLPSDHPARPVFGYFDLIITAITGDRRKDAVEE